MPPRVQNRKEPAWSTVVLLLIFFWPVGLYLLYRKLSIPPISRQGGVALLIVGTVFAAFGVLDIIKRTTGWPPSLGETDFFFSSVFYTGVSVGIGLICLLAGSMLLHKPAGISAVCPLPPGACDHLFGCGRTGLVPRLPAGLPGTAIPDQRRLPEQRLSRLHPPTLCFQPSVAPITASSAVRLGQRAPSRHPGGSRRRTASGPDPGTQRDHP